MIWIMGCVVHVLLPEDTSFACYVLITLMQLYSIFDD